MYSRKSGFLLELDKKYTDEIILEGGLKLYLDPSYRPEWNVTVSGVIKACPRGYNGPLKEGTKVWFSYMVVNNKSWGSDADFFTPLTEGNDKFREWQDKRGRQIKVVAFPGAITDKWVGVLYQDGVIDGCQGSQSDVERWLSQFKFGSNEELIYKNLLEIDGKDYWMCDDNLIFAYKKGKEMVAYGEYVILKPIEIDLTESARIMGHIHIPDGYLKHRRDDCGRVVSVNEADFKVSDTVFFNPIYAEKYDFDGKNYYIVKKSRIFCKE